MELVRGFAVPDNLLQSCQRFANMVPAETLEQICQRVANSHSEFLQESEHINMLRDHLFEIPL